MLLLGQDLKDEENDGSLKHPRAGGGGGGLQIHNVIHPLMPDNNVY
jgi:hypothetical protein